MHNPKISWTLENGVLLYYVASVLIAKLWVVHNSGKVEWWHGVIIDGYASHIPNEFCRIRS